LNDDVPTGEPPRDDRSAGETVAAFRDDVVMALRFFSRLPSGQSPHQRPDLDRIALGVPFASLVIGAGPALLLLVGLWLGLPPLFAAGLALVAQVLVTGGMAEDGIADAADGLFGGGTAERRLEIMRDSRHGSYGVAALCLFLLLKAAALAGIGHPLEAAALWLAAGILARSGALVLSAALPPARRDGASAAAGRARKHSLLIGGAFALAIGFLIAAPAVGIFGVGLALLLALPVLLGWTALCARLVGGQTGDLIGALQALLEIAVLAGFLLMR